MRPEVRIPTQTSDRREQVVLGKLSALTSDIEEFLGIPYGIVPRRWEHSILRTSLPIDVFDASQHGPKCPQPSAPNNSDVFQSHLDFPDVVESETECLNLFIVRPSPAALSKVGHVPTQSSLPVYFYIHGGGFGFGAGSDPMWDPTRLVQHSLAVGKPFIAVMINYRLNIFGFGASSSIVASQQGSQLEGCNFGLHDQKLALKWVSRNISSFGGDPHRITLGGQSAGGCSVHTHVLEARSSVEPPLFARAIIQSGAFTTAGIGPVPLKTCDKRWSSLCEYFGLVNQPESQKLEMLRYVSAADLLKATDQLGWMVFNLTDDDLTIKASPDGKWIVDFDQKEDGNGSQDRSKTVDPMQVFMGYTEAEGSLFIANALPKLQTYEKVFNLYRKAFSSDATATTILEIYGIKPDIPVSTIHQGLIRYVTDVTFGYSVFQAHQDLFNLQNQKSASRETHNPSMAISRAMKSQLYLMKFGNPFPGPSYEVAHHCVDLIYIFDAFRHDLKAKDEQEKQDVSKVTCRSNSALRQDIQTTWVDFINSGAKDVQEDMAVVYEQDRTIKLESLQNDTKWIEQKRRFDMIAVHQREAQDVVDRLFALGK